MKTGQHGGWCRTATSLLGGAMVVALAAGGAPTDDAVEPVEPYATPASPPVHDADEPVLDHVDPAEVLRAAEANLEEARVLLRTGRELVGLLVETGERSVTLRVRGEEMTIDLADTIEFDTLGPVLESFRDLRAATPDDDVPGRLHLVRWLRDRGAYFTALDEIQRIIRHEPFNTDAAELGVWLKEQIRLKIRAVTEPVQSEDRPEARTPRRRIHEFPVLSPEEINLIRVYEVDFDDPPRLHIPRPVVERFIDLHADHEVVPRTPEGRQALLRRDSLTVLDLMFRAQARELYGEVRVLEDPNAMRLFRTEIHKTWLVGSSSGCASTSCHGGQEAGRLYLNRHRANSDATVYTNFLILERFRLKDGTPLIDHDEPANSPLLQMALPRERSSYPHPNVTRTEGRRGWRPFFRDQDEIRFRRAVEWVRSLYRPRPEYPIEYTPPVPRGAQRAENLPPPGER